MPQARTRVLFVSNTYDPEPGVVHGLGLAKWLVAHGYDVKVLTCVPWYPLGRVYPGYTMKLWQWENREGIPILRVPIYPSHDQSALRRIATYVSFLLTGTGVGVPLIGDFDIVRYFDNTPTTGTVAWICSMLRGVPMTQHIADLWPESVIESGMLHGWPKRLAEHAIGSWCDFLYRRNARTTVLSPGFKAHLVARGVDANKIDVIYNWADEDKFFPVAPDPELKRSLQMNDKFNIVYAGNVGPLQALDKAVEAMGMLRDHPRAQLVIVGAGPKDEEVRAVASRLQLTNVLFLGRRPLEQMNAINALADVLLVSLRDIPFMHATIPSKTQVALASGRPVLLSVAGDAAALIEEARAGVAVPPEDPAALAAAIRRLAELPDEVLGEMGRRGRAFYEQRLSLKVGAELTDRIFREILAERQPRPRRPKGSHDVPKGTGQRDAPAQ